MERKQRLAIVRISGLIGSNYAVASEKRHILRLQCHLYGQNMQDAILVAEKVKTQLDVRQAARNKS